MPAKENQPSVAGKEEAREEPSSALPEGGYDFTPAAQMPSPDGDTAGENKVATSLSDE